MTSIKRIVAINTNLNLQDERLEEISVSSRRSLLDFNAVVINVSELTDYGYCQFDQEEHKKLYKCFKKTNCKCLMIIGKSDFIEKLYKKYIVNEYDKNYKFKLYDKRIDKKINNKHLIIKNY